MSSWSSLFLVSFYIFSTLLQHRCSSWLHLSPRDFTLLPPYLYPFVLSIPTHPSSLSLPPARSILFIPSLSHHISYASSPSSFFLSLFFLLLLYFPSPPKTPVLQNPKTFEPDFPKSIPHSKVLRFSLLSLPLFIQSRGLE